MEQLQSIYARIASSVVLHNLLHIHAGDWAWQGRNRQGREDLGAKAVDQDDEELELPVVLYCRKYDTSPSDSF